MTNTSGQIMQSSSSTERLKSALKSTKLYWGLALLFLVGVISSPVSSKGHNIFLSFGNLSDVFRQISVTGITAVGMTLVILIAGIDLSVGSVLALGSVVCAMLLTNEGWSSAYLLGVPAIFLLAFLVVFGVLSFGTKLQRRATLDAGTNPPAISKLRLGVAAAAALVLHLEWH